MFLSVCMSGFLLLPLGFLLLFLSLRGHGGFSFFFQATALGFFPRHFFFFHTLSLCSRSRSRGLLSSRLFPSLFLSTFALFLFHPQLAVGPMTDRRGSQPTAM